MYYIISECLISLIGNDFIFHSEAEPKTVKSVKFFFKHIQIIISINAIFLFFSVS